jgi:uncharacterized membrane protein YkgB
LARSNPATLVGNLGRLGLWLFLGLLFLEVGLEQLTPYGAGRTASLAASSPLLAWSYRLWGVRGAGALLGATEIAVGLGLLSGLWRPAGWPARAAAIGAALATAVGVSLLFTAPGVVAGHTLLRLPLLSFPVGQLLAQHAVLFAASLLLVAESLGGGRR